MKSVTNILLGIATLAAVASASYAREPSVYCQVYADGYSLFRVSDNKDIGYAYFLDYDECTAAADLANEVAQNVACSPYINSAEEIYGYAAYRISDDEALGGYPFELFEQCQSAVRETRNGYLCLIFSIDSGKSYARYSVETGDVMGDVIYPSIEQCQMSY